MFCIGRYRENQRKYKKYHFVGTEGVDQWCRKQQNVGMTIKAMYMMKDSHTHTHTHTHTVRDRDKNRGKDEHRSRNRQS